MESIISRKEVDVYVSQIASYLFNQTFTFQMRLCRGQAAAAAMKNGRHLLKIFRDYFLLSSALNFFCIQDCEVFNLRTVFRILILNLIKLVVSVKEAEWRSGSGRASNPAFTGSQLSTVVVLLHCIDIGLFYHCQTIAISKMDNTQQTNITKNSNEFFLIPTERQFSEEAFI